MQTKAKSRSVYAATGAHTLRRRVAGPVARVVRTGVAVVCAACNDGTGPSTDPSAILFSGRAEFTDDDVYLVRLGDQSLMQLTNDGLSGRAEWSPDGTRIAFESRRGITGFGAGRIFVMEADGGAQRALSAAEATDDVGPVWSPDGTRVLFVRHGELHRMSLDGSGIQRLTDGFAPVTGHTWSPDGSRIAFASRVEGNAEIYVMPADGGVPVNQSNADGSDQAPAWSPDGTRLAFESLRHGNPEILVVDLEGGALTRITNDPAGDTSPAWSPDGGQLAFVSLRDRNVDVYAVTADGTGLRNLSASPAVDAEPRWSPDGRHIAFTSDRSGDLQIYVVRSDGTELTQVTEFAGPVFVPRWRPQ